MRRKTVIIRLFLTSITIFGTSLSMGAETDFVLGSFPKERLESRISDWWGYNSGTIRVVKTESGRFDLGWAYERVKEDKPFVGKAIEVGVEASRQSLKDVCYNMGANFDIKLCAGDRHYVYLAGIPNYSDDTRVMCSTNIPPGQELSISLSDCNIFTPNGDGSFSRTVFQTHNRKYHRQRSMNVTKAELENTGEIIVAQESAEMDGFSEVTYNGETDLGTETTTYADTTFPQTDSTKASKIDGATQAYLRGLPKLKRDCFNNSRSSTTNVIYADWEKSVGYQKLERCFVDDSDYLVELSNVPQKFVVRRWGSHIHLLGIVSENGYEQYPLSERVAKPSDYDDRDKGICDKIVLPSDGEMNVKCYWDGRLLIEHQI